MLERNLSGIYFRGERDGKWHNIDITDMSDIELKELTDKLIKSNRIEMLKGLVIALAKTVREIGDKLDLCRGEEDD